MCARNRLLHALCWLQMHLVTSAYTLLEQSALVTGGRDPQRSTITRCEHPNVNHRAYPVTTSHSTRICLQHWQVGPYSSTASPDLCLHVQTLERSYLLRVNGKVVERPQHMLMRVSVGMHQTDIESVIQTYHMLSERWFTHASPTLFNAGTPRPQLSSCFLICMKSDSIEVSHIPLSLV